MATANNLGTAYIRIAPQMQGIQSTITKQLSGLGSSASSSFSSAFTAKGGAIAGAVAGVVSTVANKALGAITDSIDGAIARIDTLNAFPKIMKNLGFEASESSSSLDKLSSRIEGLPTTLDEIVSYTQCLASTTGNLNKGIYNATNLAIAFNDAALSGGKGQLEANRAFEQFVQVVSRGRPSMQDWKIMMEVMPGQLKQMAKYMGTNNKSIQEYAKNAKKTADELDGLDLYNWISEDKNEHAKERLDQLQKAMIDLDNNGGAGITSFKDQVGDATHTIGNALRLIPIRIQKAMAEVIKAIGTDGIYDAVDKFTSSFKGIGEIIAKRVVPPIKNTLGPIFKSLVPVIKKIAESVGTLIKTIAGSQELKDRVSLFAAILPKIGKLLGSIISLLLQLASVAVTISDAIWRNVLQPIAEKVQPILEWVFGSLAVVVGTLADAIQSQLSNIGAFFDGFFTGVKQGLGIMRDFFVGVFNNIVAGAKAIIEPIGAAFKSALNVIKTIFSPVVEIFREHFKAIKDAFKPIVDVGRDIVKGLWNGIKDMGKWIAQKIQSFGEDVLQGIKDFFGIKSPSRVMAEQGKYLAQGLGVGIVDNAKYAVSAMEEMGKEVLKESASITPVVGATLDGRTPLSPSANGLSAQTGGNAQPTQIVQNNTFNQVANDLDVKEASRKLGWEVAIAI